MGRQASGVASAWKDGTGTGGPCGVGTGMCDRGLGPKVIGSWSGLLVGDMASMRITGQVSRVHGNGWCLREGTCCGTLWCTL